MASGRLLVRNVLFSCMVDNIVVNLSTSECILAQAPYLVADW